MEPSVDTVYAALLDRILTTGQEVVTRNARVKRTFAEKVVFASTPLVAARKTAWRNCLREWEWFMSGSENINDLHPSVRPSWAPWADADGWIANNYGVQLRFFVGHYGHNGAVDQIAAMVDGVRNHPFSRRNVITTWNTADMLASETTITNCHGTVIQAFVTADDSLHLVTYQRSADVVCGLPHNWIQYWAFLLWLANRSGRTPGTLTWLGGDVHVYEQHWDLAREIIAAVPQCSPTPQLVYVPTDEDFRTDDFTLSGEYWPVVVKRAEMVV